MKLVLCWLFIMFQIVTPNSTVKQIQQCGVHCSKGVQCKSRPHLSLSTCQEQHSEAIVPEIHNVFLSTVVRCDGGKCSLNLNIVVMLTLFDDIRGISMCLHSPGLLARCQTITFPKSAKENVNGVQIDVQYDCFLVKPGQDVFVILKTVPIFCNDLWTQKYTVPECSHEDMRGRIPECITEELTYTVNPARREITVKVSKAPEDTSYHLRLCLKGYTCVGTGAHKLIKKEDLHRNVSFQYSKALPCLCIEGWPAMIDARRIQVCPFKHNTELLWSGVTYKHYEQSLSWKPLCPVKAVISLCHAVDSQTCLDLGNASISSEGGDVSFSTVDPHPQLCMKFTTEAGSWVECPFSSQHFPVWHLKVAGKADQHWTELTSYFPATFSVSLCKMDNSTCNAIEETQVLTISVDKMKPAAVNKSMNMCGRNICIQVRRTDVLLAIQELHCNFQCFGQELDQQHNTEEHKYTLPLAICVIIFITAGLVFIAAFKASGSTQRQKLINKTTHKPSAEKETWIHTLSEDMISGLRKN